MPQSKRSRDDEVEADIRPGSIAHMSKDTEKALDKLSTPDPLHVYWGDPPVTQAVAAAAAAAEHKAMVIHGTGGNITANLMNSQPG